MSAPLAAPPPYVIRDSGSVRGLSYWSKWDNGCPRAAVLTERDKLAEVPGLEDDVSASPAPSGGEGKTEVKDNGASIGILIHAMLDYWMRKLVAKPSDTPFAPHKHATERHLFVAGAVADDFAARMNIAAAPFKCMGQDLFGTLIGTEMEVAAGRDLWGGAETMMELGLKPEERDTPLTGIDDLVTLLSEEQAQRLNTVLLRTDYKPGIAIWDWKSMDYLSSAPRYTSGYTHHTYSLMTGRREDLVVSHGTASGHGFMGFVKSYPTNFTYVCMERGKGIKPKLSAPLFVRKGTPDPAIDLEQTRSFLIRAATKRAQHFDGVDLARCEVSPSGFLIPCHYGPKGRAICTQRPGLEVVSG